MRAIVLVLLLLVTLTSCESLPKSLADVPSVSYYDKNGDGVVDYELHHPMKPGEPDWALEDQNFDGYYDYDILYGKTIVIKEPVHIPVPRNIHFTRPSGQKSKGARPPKT